MYFEFNFKKFRIREGISQKRLSAKTGLAQSYISKLESSSYKHKSPTLRTIWLISKALNICPYTLICCKKQCNTCKLKKV